MARGVTKRSLLLDARMSLRVEECAKCGQRRSPCSRTMLSTGRILNSFSPEADWKSLAKLVALIENEKQMFWNHTKHTVCKEFTKVDEGEDQEEDDDDEDDKEAKEEEV